MKLFTPLVDERILKLPGRIDEGLEGVRIEWLKNQREESAAAIPPLTSAVAAPVWQSRRRHLPWPGAIIADWEGGRQHLHEDCGPYSQ